MIVTTRGAHQHKHMIVSVAHLGILPSEWSGSDMETYVVTLRYLGQFFADNRFRVSRSQRVSSRQVQLAPGSPPAGQFGNLMPAQPLGDLRNPKIPSYHSYVTGVALGHDVSNIPHGPYNLRPPAAHHTAMYVPSYDFATGFLVGWQWISRSNATPQQIAYYLACGGELEDAQTQPTMVGLDFSLPDVTLPVGPEATLAAFRLRPLPPDPVTPDLTGLSPEEAFQACLISEDEVCTICQHPHVICDCGAGPEDD